MSSKIGVITLMRGEKDLVEGLDEKLRWTPEWHLVETAGEVTSLDLQHPGVQLHHFPLPLGACFENARTEALRHCSAKWVLVLDTDEEVAPQTVSYLEGRLDEWDERGVAGVWMPRLNHVLGHPMRSPNQWPDWQLRLVRADKVRFPTRLHDKYEVDGEEEHLPSDEAHAILHYPFRSTAQYVDKMNVYSTIELENVVPRVFPPGLAAARATKYFLTRYLRQKAFLDGPTGLHFCLVMAFTRYLSETKKWEAQVVGTELEGPAGHFMR